MLIFKYESICHYIQLSPISSKSVLSVKPLKYYLQSSTFNVPASISTAICKVNHTQCFVCERALLVSCHSRNVRDTM